MGPPKLSFSVTERHSSPDERKQRKKRQIVPRCLTQTCSILFGVLWLAPALIIVAINFQGQVNPRTGVVGQSIGCLGNRGKCTINLQDVGQISKAQHLAEMDRNALGALQLVAKALEIWFVTIAASLVFTMVKTVARHTSRPALPLRYIFLHSTLSEFLALGKLLFSDPLKTLFKRLLKQIRGKQSKQDEGLLHKSEDIKSNLLWHRSRLYLFSIFIVLVSITCSLMGPATAVLVLPNLQWTEINKNTGPPLKWLDNLQAGQPPHDIPVPGCEPRDFTSGNFSCLFGYYGAFINSLAATAIATDVQAWPDHSSTSSDDSLIVLPVFQEGNVTFSANVSGGILVSWVPLRQSVRGFNEDVADFDSAISSTTPPQPGYPDSDLFKKSLQARLQRHGPTVGMKSICILNGANEQTVSIFTIRSDQAVRCYEANGEASCIPSGTGWPGINVSSSSFTIEDSNTTEPESVNMSVYSASISLTMVNATFQSIKNGSEPGWNWSTAFSNQSLISTVAITGPIQAVEYYSPGYDPDSSIWCTSNYALGTANYVLDPSKVTNLLRLIELNVDHEDGSLDAGTPLYVDSDWILAGWAVDRNGFVSGDVYISGHLIDALQNFIFNGTRVRASLDFVNLHRFITIQSLSLIPFTDTSTKPSNKTIAADKSLSRSAQIQAWSFSLGSRTSILGVTVIMIGCLLTIMRTIMYYHCRADTMDATAILESILNGYSLAQNERATEMKEDYPTLVMDDTAGVIGFRA